MDIEKIKKELAEYMPEPIDMASLKDKSNKELLDIIYRLDLSRCVHHAMYDELKKKQTGHFKQIQNKNSSDITE